MDPVEVGSVQTASGLCKDQVDCLLDVDTLYRHGCNFEAALQVAQILEQLSAQGRHVRLA